MTYKMLEDKFKDIPKDFDTYEKYGLNEEGILLFTNYISLRCPNDDLVQRIFGRQPNSRMYLIMPNAVFSITKGISNGNDAKNYEILQSQTLGKQLILAKMNRII